MSQVSSGARVFISYSRKNRAVAEQLRDLLIDQGFDAYLDLHDIAPGEPWKERLGALILSAEKVIFLISPDSVTSPICTWEVDTAEAQGKGILPVVVHDVEADAIPGRLRRLNFVFFRTATERDSNLPALFDALSRDLAWEREKTRINDLAIEWSEAGRPRRRLVTRDDRIREMEYWRDRHPATSLAPTTLQLEFIAESRRRQIQRQRSLVSALTAIAIIVAVLGIATNESRVTAGLRGFEAQLNAESIAISAAVGRRDSGRALVRALHAYSEAERELGAIPSAVWNALRVAYEGTRLRKTVPMVREPLSLVWRKDGGLSNLTASGGPRCSR